MQIAPLTIVPVRNMRYAGQLLDYVRIRHRHNVNFSGLPILLQLRTTDWQSYLEKLQQAFNQQHGIFQSLDTLPSMSDWNTYLSEQKQCHLLVLRLLEPASVDILCKLIQWAVIDKPLATSIYVIVAVDEELPKHDLIKQAMQVAGTRVDTYIHNTTDNSSKRKATGRLWPIAAILAMVVIGCWFLFGKPEWLSFDKKNADTVTSISTPSVIAESAPGLSADTKKTEIWNYRVESEWLKRLPVIEQDDSTVTTQLHDNTGDPASIGSQATAIDQSSIARLESEAVINHEQLTNTFNDALKNNDLQWLKTNAEALSQWHSTDGQSVLMFLAEGNHIEWVNTLLEQGAKPNVVNSHNWTALLVSAVHGRFEIANALLDAGAKPNHTTNEGRSALMAAVHNQYPNVAELLLQHGADVNQQSNDGWSPLFYAVWNQDIALVEMLLAAGARQNLVSTTGIHAIDIAQQRNNQQVIDLLNNDS